MHVAISENTVFDAATAVGFENKKKPEGYSPSGPEYDPGNDLLSRLQHYHRRRRLNDRVRNGNGCGPPAIVTGKLN